MRKPRLLVFAAIVLLSALSSLGPQSVAFARPTRTCGPDTYVNVSGNCVHRPVEANRPSAGATAKCNDGTYSFSQHRRGTCSHHGGVAVWL